MGRKHELDDNECGYCGQTLNHFIVRTEKTVLDLEATKNDGSREWYERSYDTSASLQKLSAHYEKHLLKEMKKE